MGEAEGRVLLPRRVDENNNLTLCALCGQRVSAHDGTLCPPTTPASTPTGKDNAE